MSLRMSSVIGSNPPPKLTPHQKFANVQEDIEELIKITDKYLNEGFPITHRERLVYNSYNPVLSPYKDHFHKLHPDDIAQQVRIAYFTVLSRYFQEPRNLHDKQYKVELNYQVTWAVRDWMRNQLKKLHREDVHPELPAPSPTCKYLELNLGPGFLMKGSDLYPYSLLSNYDRLLIHLAFYEDLSDSEIGRLLQRDRTMVRHDIDRILDYLRRCYER